MFTQSAAFYDLIYSSLKDYPAEAQSIATLLHAAHRNCHSVLDIACGTGEHARLLADVHGFEVDGIDLDMALTRIASAKHAAGRFDAADMVDFHLGRRYDAVVCLFSSIGYVRTVSRLHEALSCFKEHLNDGGIVVVEPFFTPEAIRPGHTATHSVEAEGVRVTRVNHSEVEGRLFRLHFDYLIEEGGGTRRTTEVHELGLFTIDEMLDGFASAGLIADYNDTGLTGRGLYVASIAS